MRKTHMITSLLFMNVNNTAKNKKAANMGCFLFYNLSSNSNISYTIWSNISMVGVND